MTTTPNPPASIESLREIFAKRESWLSEKEAADLSAALSELEGLRSERLHWLAKSAEEVSALRADLAAERKAEEEVEGRYKIVCEQERLGSIAFSAERSRAEALEALMTDGGGWECAHGAPWNKKCPERQCRLNPIRRVLAKLRAANLLPTRADEKEPNHG